MKKWFQCLLLLVLISLGSSCALLQPPMMVVLVIPDRPILHVCPEFVVVEGDIVGDRISLTLVDAQKLRTWIHSYLACAKTNTVILDGHIEKLENRLKAFGGR